jgi:hypothetical protein
MPNWEFDDLGDYGVCRTIGDVTSVRVFHGELAQLDPRIVKVEIDANQWLHIGIGGQWAFVEHICFEPWKPQIAVLNNRSALVGIPATIRFQADGASDTEILAQYLIPVSEAIELVVHMFQGGTLPETIQWDLV